MDEQEKINLELEDNQPEAEEKVPVDETIPETDFDAAVEDIQEDVEEAANKIVNQLKDAVKKGHASRITIKKNEEVILNLPLSYGILGTVLGAIAAPWALILATITTIGLDCKVEVTKTDGSVIDVSGKTVGQKIAKAGNAIVEDVKDAFKD